MKYSMEKKTLQQRLNDIAFAISILKREQEYLLKQVNYKKCSDCVHFSRVKNKRITTLRCLLANKYIVSSRTKACKDFKP